MTEELTGIRLLAPPCEAAASVLTPEALAFVVGLERQFGTRRLELLGEDVGEFGGLRCETVGLRVGDVIADGVEVGLHGGDAGGGGP